MVSDQSPPVRDSTSRLGVAAGVSCPDNLIPKFLDLGVQYFHSNVASLLQSAGQAYLKTVRQASESKR